MVVVGGTKKGASWADFKLAILRKYVLEARVQRSITLGCGTGSKISGRIT